MDALTGFRFMAIMVIIISHLEFIGEYEKIGLFYKTYIHNATLGVDYFFMLSGFGMMLSYQKKSNSPMINGVKDCIMFAKKHVKKIYILYLISMASTIPYYIYMNITAWGGGTSKTHY
ncbi:acyltransferase family protein [Anaerobutyricum hallii]|nr:acyltransferase family protein [Anaerobutyricum hallii]